MSELLIFGCCVLSVRMDTTQLHMPTPPSLRSQYVYIVISVIGNYAMHECNFVKIVYLRQIYCLFWCWVHNYFFLTCMPHHKPKCSNLSAKASCFPTFSCLIMFLFSLHLLSGFPWKCALLFGSHLILFQTKSTIRGWKAIRYWPVPGRWHLEDWLPQLRKVRTCSLQKAGE